jgi:glycine dehydrogenase subunit 2
VDLDALRAACDGRTAGLMLTNPNTMGVFEKQIEQVAKIVHEAGGLLYYDGANLNAISGRTRPGDMGFDVMHVNLHKTFSTPHGGGGPGAGPVGVKAHLKDFLPRPWIVRSAPAEGNGSSPERYEFSEGGPDSIGKMMAFHGNTGILVRAWCYMLMLGADGIRRIATYATLNANYLKARLKERYQEAIPGTCSHEFILTLAKEAKENHVTAFNVAKRLLDKGFHSPTVYFPTTVRECLLIEPTETETKRTLDAFIDAMMEIRDEIESGSEDLLEAPRELEMARLDDVKAAKDLNVCCRF